MEEEIFQIALTQLKGIGLLNTKTLVSVVGSARRVFELSTAEISELSGLKKDKIEKFQRENALTRAQEELKFIKREGIAVYYYKATNYPKALKFCEDSPIVLFVKGNIDFNRENLAVVGTRKASTYGKKMTRNLVRDIAPFEKQIVSGLAHGIDKEAHQAALENGLSTIGVLGHGLDLIYPAAHKELARKMLDTGGLITEFLSSSPRDASNFPKRNRIVAGMSAATVVIESALAGGSLITARLANDYGRDVFAFPGNADAHLAAGCNNLIRRDIARLITNAEELANFMNWSVSSHKAKPEQTNLFNALTVEENRLFRLFENQKEIHMDDLIRLSSFETGELAMLLFNLEMRGMIESKPGMFYTTKG